MVYVVKLPCGGDNVSLSDREIEILLYVESHSGIYRSQLLAEFSGNNDYHIFAGLLEKRYIRLDGCFECAPFDNTTWDSKVVLAPQGAAVADEYRRNVRRQHLEVISIVVAVIGVIVALFELLGK